MKAIVIHAAKDLRIEDRPEETPGPGQLRLRLAMGGVCGSDLHYYNHGGFGAVRLREPMILGHEVSAIVEEIGTGVRRSSPEKWAVRLSRSSWPIALRVSIVPLA